MRIVQHLARLALASPLACGGSAPARDAAALETLDAAADADAMLDAQPSGEGDAQLPIRVLAFSRTQGYRHASIEVALAMLDELAQQGQIEPRATEDPAQLLSLLGESDVVLFLSTSGEVLDAVQQDALESFVREGGGFVGVHAAADTEYEWPFYAELLGARFDGHPAIQPARLVVEAPDHPAAEFLPPIWEREDEWYNFDRNPRAQVEVLLSLDESSYEGGTHGADHPIAWCRTLGRGRSFYSALGHTEASWREPLFMRHIEQALIWAAGR